MSKQLYCTVDVVIINGYKFMMYGEWHYGELPICHDTIRFESFDALRDWLPANSWFHGGGLCTMDDSSSGKVQRKIISTDYIFTAENFKAASYEHYTKIIKDVRIPQIAEKLPADDFWDYCRDMISREKAGPYSYAFNGYIPWSR